MTTETSAPADAMPPRKRGRPRKVSGDTDILRAAIELIAERGVDKTTLSAVARKAGVARATVYLRWPTRSALVGSAARFAVGGTPMTLTGDIEADIRLIAAFIRNVFTGPVFPALLPEMVRGTLARPQEIHVDEMAPNRPIMAGIYSRGAAAAGFDANLDPNLIVDMLLGTAILQLMAKGRGMTPDEANDLAEVVIRGLRVRA